MQAVCSTSVSGIKGLSVARSSGQLHHLKWLGLLSHLSKNSSYCFPLFLEWAAKMFCSLLQAEPPDPAQLVSRGDVLCLLSVKSPLSLVDPYLTPFLFCSPRCMQGSGQQGTSSSSSSFFDVSYRCSPRFGPGAYWFGLSPFQLLKSAHSLTFTLNFRSMTDWVERAQARFWESVALRAGPSLVSLH